LIAEATVDAYGDDEQRVDRKNRQSAHGSGSLPIPTATARTGTPSQVLWLLLGLSRTALLRHPRLADPNFTDESPDRRAVGVVSMLRAGLGF
jgi:hypothetical protein